MWNSHASSDSIILEQALSLIFILELAVKAKIILEPPDPWSLKSFKREISRI